MIIKANKGKKSLDDLMQVLYTKYYKELKRGFTTDELRTELEAMTKTDLEEFFNDHIDGVETIDYPKYLKEVGLTISLQEGEQVLFGATASDDGGRVMVKRITAGSAAEKNGLSVNDEVIAFNGFRVTKSTFIDYTNALQPGDTFNLIINRDNQLMVLDCVMGTLPFVKYSFELDEENKLGHYWLRTL